MKKSILSAFLALILIALSLESCMHVPDANPSSIPPSITSTITNIPATITSTPTLILPTNTPQPTSTVTPIPSPTQLPGSVVLPADTLSKNIPWLPMDNTKRPGIGYYFFNAKKPPFNDVLVRQAFVAAIDRSVIVKVAQKYGAKDAKPATSFTPPQTLGRDLTNEVGISFNPAKAKALLEQAGYTTVSSFPPVELWINVGGDAAPGFHIKIADEMVKMWQEYLGIKVTVKAMSWEVYQERIASNPPEIFRMGWMADYNDPDNFLREIFHSGSKYNYGNFSSLTFDRIVEKAAKTNDPAERQELYIMAERILCETEAAIIPLYHLTYNNP